VVSCKARFPGRRRAGLWGKATTRHLYGPRRQRGKATGPGVGWHTGDAYSQLAKAARRVSQTRQEKIVIAHLDTGYDPSHHTKPANIDEYRQYNVIDNNGDARDVATVGPLKNPGHGPATLGILAGGPTTVAEWAGFAGSVGGAPFATVVPVRVADGVVHFTTGNLVKGFQYAIRTLKAHVLTDGKFSLLSAGRALAISCALAGLALTVTG